MRKIKYLFFVFLFLLMLTGCTVQAEPEKTPGIPCLVSVKATGYDCVKVTWKKATNAVYYRIYYKKDGKWVRVGKTTGTSFCHKNSDKRPLVPGGAYKYTVKAFRTEKIYGKFDTTGLSVKMPFPQVGIPQNIMVTCKNQKEMELSWKKVEGAERYFVYTKKENRWTRIGTTSDTSFIHKSSVKAPLSPGQYYTYTVRAAVKVNGTYFYGDYDKQGVMGAVFALESTQSLNQKLRKRAQSIIAKITSPKMTKDQKLNACFDWIMSSVYRPNMNWDRSEKDWQYSCAYEYLRSHTGSCHNFSVGFAALARELGYTAYVISIPDVHSFVWIDGKYWDNLHGGLRAVTESPMQYTREQIICL